MSTPSEIQKLAKTPLKDAAAVNAHRWALFNRLKKSGLPVETGTGGRTKFNRTRLNLPKQHWIDAACVGASTPENLKLSPVQPLRIKAAGRGSRRMCRPDKYGFPRSKPKDRAKQVNGFSSGDMARLRVTSGKYQGSDVGRIATRARGAFDISAVIKGKIQKITSSWKNFELLHKADGYSYVAA
jgi:hypothetical protein